ncbi:MAG: lipopolysaccharide biosynthesis protein [Pacificimonas sp.]
MNVPSNPTQRSGSLAALAGNFAWLLGGRGFAAVFSLIYLAILTRTLGQEGYGQFSLIIGTAQVVTAFVGFQTWQIVVRYGMERLRTEREEALVGLLKYCICLDIGGAIAGVGLSLLAIFTLAPVFGWSDELVRFALLFSAASLISVRSTPAGILRLFDRFALAANVEAALTGARLVAAIIVWLTAPGIGAFILAWAASELFAAGLSWLLAWRTTRHLDWRSVGAHPRETLGDTPGLGRFTLTTNVTQTVGLAGRQVPVLLTGMFVGPIAAGGFQIALQLGHALTKLGSLAVQTLLPEMMRAKTFALDQQRFSKLIWGSLKIAALAGAVILAIVILAGQFALAAIAGPDFADAYPLLVIIAIASTINLAAVPLEPALYAGGGDMAALKVRVMTALLAVGGMFILGTRYGANGIALAVLGGAVLGTFFLGVSLHRNLKATR